ncbi:hypothetical protein I4F81_006889 [Pyropia yezoensis]|uniref:Uncharacterized protein n=1 Tax=Pyropia yezoensis TaxID=2788 RepID=A0ACC3C303_PYRYE|nr:hypothetical protein I4F81_006889 [Neopyropia yezoensis]
MPAPVGTPADIAFGAAFAALAVAGLATMARGFSAAPTPPRGNTRNVALPGQRGGNDKKPGDGVMGGGVFYHASGRSHGVAHRGKSERRYGGGSAFHQLRL